MKTYPHQATDPAAYAAALARVIADPFAQRVTELLWHGTQDYQRFIARDGLEAQQQLLAKLRSEVGRLQDRLPRLAGAIAADETRAAGMRAEVAELATSPDYRAARRIQRLRATASQIDTRLGADRAAVRSMKKVLPLYQDAAGRLEAALVQFVIAPAKREDAPAPAPAPVIHVTVEAPPPAKPTSPLPVIVTAMPTRVRTTDVERDAAGEIVGALQLEKDA